MSTHLDILAIRKRLGRETWTPPQPFGPDGWRMVSKRARGCSVIVTAADHDGVEFIHASIAKVDALPTYADLVELHHAVYGEGWAYQVFAPASEHVNIHPNALHLWGRLDGSPVLPRFARMVGNLRSI